MLGRVAKDLTSKGKEMKGFFADFKKFAMRGNVIDLAVGIIIGAAFGTITKSMVDDVMMPPLGVLTSNVDFKDLYVPLDFDRFEALKRDLLAAEQERVRAENAARAARNEPPLLLPDEIRPSIDQMKQHNIPTVRYGLFINACINFVFVAFAVFLLVKFVTKLQRESPPPPPKPAELTTTERLLTEIRDELKSKSPPARS